MVHKAQLNDYKLKECKNKWKRHTPSQLYFWNNYNNKNPNYDVLETCRAWLLELIHKISVGTGVINK